MTKTSSFSNTLAKLAIGSLDDTRLSVEAHYNPKELALQLPVGWTSKNPQKTGFDMQYDGSQPKTMELEMMFDAYEQDASVTVQDQLDALEQLASPRDPDSTIAEMLRPHYCVVTWGEKGVHPLRCVIMSVATKVTMFAKDGTPRRAVANVKVQEVRFQKDDEEHESGYRTQVRAAARRARG